MSARILALMTVALFVGSVLTGFTAEMNEIEQPDVLENQVEVSYAATSPGHVVFSQYISSDNCPHCYKTGGGSAAHHKLKSDFPDDYVYVTYMSASYGDTDTARAGNVAPYNWAWSTGGAPDSYMGDRTDQRDSGASANYDTYDAKFSAGGGMHTDVNDYSMTASVIPNAGSTHFDIDISYKYIGSATPASNMKLYAAIVEKDCTTWTYSGSSGLPHGYNCWMGWLTAGDTYKSRNAGTGTAFESVTVSSTESTLSWSTVPTSLIAGGTSNAVVVAVLMSGNQVSVGGTSEHVYHATDSTMGPKMDLAITSFDVKNPSATAGYINGDSITVDVGIENVGDLDYSDGGNIEFFTKDGANFNVVDTVAINNLIVGATQTASANIDTTNLPETAWKSTFGARIANTGDHRPANNLQIMEVDHDRSPITKKPSVVGSNEVFTGEEFTVLAKGDADDGVDDIDSINFDVEISPAGLDQWTDSIVGEESEVVYRETSNEGREYKLTPTVGMEAGWYDIRSRAVDARGQTGDWSVATGVDGFRIKNAAPVVTAEPVPTVMCDRTSKVSMVGHISDAETALEDLVVTSNDASFIAWHADTQEIEVKFAWSEINGCPLGQNGIEVTVDDGGDWSEAGQLPYGTLLFNVIENGQPRWAGLPTQTIDEGSSGILGLMPFVSDTDDEGNAVASETLTLQIMDNTNPEAIAVSLVNNNLAFETTDDDINGETTVTLRASDGEQYSDQTIVIQINGINDAPRIDMSEIESITLKKGKQMVIDLSSRVSDVDDNAAEAFITVTPSEPGAARYNLIDGTMTLLFEEVGEQTITITATDKYDSNSYTMTVDVFDSYPFYLSKDDDGSGHMYVHLEDTYIGQTPTYTFKLTDDAPTLTSADVTWNVCNDLTGTCEGLWEYSLDVSKSNVGWSGELEIPSIFTEGEMARPAGSLYKDYYQLTIEAADSNGDTFKTMAATKWNIDQEMPAPADMDDEMFAGYLADLLELKESLEAKEEAGELSTTDSELLTSVEADLEVACEDARADCPVEQTQGEVTEADGGFNMNIVYIILGVLILAALLGVMFMRGGNGGQQEVKWEDDTLPANDMVANSMYGGAQEIFQQPVATTPVAPQATMTSPVAGPPLPATGLPAGWTMEQWQHYGQQYLDGNL